MPQLFVKRMMALPVVLVAISIIVFLAIRFAPGDPVEIATQQYASEESIEQVRREWGLDLPLWQQYLQFAGKAIRGDFGTSFFGNVDVADQVVHRFPATLELSLVAIVVSTVLGVTAGVLSAVHRGSWVDHTTRIVSMFGISMPIFWLGLMLIAFFSVRLGIFPVSGRIDARTIIEQQTGFLLLDTLLLRDWDSFILVLKHLALPAITMGLYSAGIVARFTRSSMLEILRQDYVRTARAKGLAERSVIFKHALRNALIPIVTIIGLQFGNYLGGAAVTETVFSWPGLGKLMIDSISERDYPQVQASVLAIAFTFVLVNLVVDLFYGVIDPRIRYD